MPIVKVLDRNVLNIYDRFDPDGGNGRKKLVKGKEVFVSDQALFNLKRFGIHFEVVGEDAPTEEVAPVVEEPTEEAPVEETPAVETPEVVEEAPVEEAPTEETPVEEPTEDLPVEEDTTEEVVEEVPVEEPVNETTEGDIEEVVFGGEVLKVTKKKTKKKKKTVRKKKK